MWLNHRYSVFQLYNVPVKFARFWAFIQIVTILQKNFKKVVQTADFLIYYITII